MADIALMAFKCLNSECGKQIQMKRPQKSGIYAVTCPHCGVKKPLRLKGMDALQQPGPQQNPHTPRNPGQPDELQQPKNPAEPQSSVQPKKEPIELPNVFRTNSQYTFTCPHCKVQEIGIKPTKAGQRNISCPACRGEMIINVVNPTQGLFMTETVQSLRGKLTLIRKGWLNKSFRLRQGKQVIGRQDSSYPSDISISNDSSMSRRSVEIDVQHTPKGYFYRLTVLKTTNPVVLNGQPMRTGESVLLNFGDILVMGKTKFRFDKAD